MARIEIVESLYSQIEVTFKGEGHKVLDLISSLEENPHKGKIVGVVGGIVVKELKYKNFRFYFLADGFKLKIYSKDQLLDELLKFVRMSNKKYQQKTIDEIKIILKSIGPSGFS